MGLNIVNPESWNMDLGGLVLGALIFYLKGMRAIMFQLSGFYCRSLHDPFKEPFTEPFGEPFKEPFKESTREPCN